MMTPTCWIFAAATTASAAGPAGSYATADGRGAPDPPVHSASTASATAISAVVILPRTVAIPSAAG
jgi:hypothetical protein